MSPQTKQVLGKHAIIAVISIIFGCLGFGLFSLILYTIKLNPAPAKKEVIESAKPDWEKPHGN